MKSGDTLLVGTSEAHLELLKSSLMYQLPVNMQLAYTAPKGQLAQVICCTTAVAVSGFHLQVSSKIADGSRMFRTQRVKSEDIRPGVHD